jgi:hypothetical protein
MKNPTSVVMACLLFILLNSLCADAQGAPKSKEYYEENVLYYVGGWTAAFMQGSQRYKISMFGGSRELVDLLSEAPLARPEIREYKRDNNLGWGVYWGGAGVGFAGLVMPELISDSETATYVEIGAELTWLVTAFIAAIQVSRSYSHLHKAVWEYNKYLLYDK